MWQVHNRHHLIFVSFLLFCFCFAVSFYLFCCVLGARVAFHCIHLSFSSLKNRFSSSFVRSSFRFALKSKWNAKATNDDAVLFYVFRDHVKQQTMQSGIESIEVKWITEKNDDIFVVVVFSFVFSIEMRCDRFIANPNKSTSFAVYNYFFFFSFGRFALVSATDVRLLVLLISTTLRRRRRRKHNADINR